MTSSLQRPCAYNASQSSLASQVALAWATVIGVGVSNGTGGWQEPEPYDPNEYLSDEHKMMVDDLLDSDDGENPGFSIVEVVAPWDKDD